MHSHHFHPTEVKQLLESVGLDYARDDAKRPSELSGGMVQCASLALQLAQKKHIVILDEPFTGLNEKAAKSVTKELVHLRVQYKTALLLISHELLIAALVIMVRIGKEQHFWMALPKSCEITFFGVFHRLQHHRDSV